MGGRVIWAINIAALIFVLVLAVQLSHRDKNVPQISRYLTYSFTLKNSTNRFIKNVSLWAYAPVSKTSTQTLQAIETSHPYHLTSDCHGNQILGFTIENFPPYALRNITIQTELLITKSPCRISSPDVEALYLQPELYVESDHPDIIKQAARLKKSDPQDTAAAFFNWTAARIAQSAYFRHERGALFAYTHQKGDCTEYMDLFAALCRAAGIPCRRVGGYVCDQNKLVSAGDYHNWAEFYVNGRWHVADPQNGVFMDNDGDYIATRIIGSGCPNEMKDNHRYRFEGEGITVKMDS
ncbi:MAG: transglutaminase-like domain-containing protein [Desulfosudaceae bacterium]